MIRISLVVIRFVCVARLRVTWDHREPCGEAGRSETAVPGHHDGIAGAERERGGQVYGVCPAQDVAAGEQRSAAGDVGSQFDEGDHVQVALPSPSGFLLRSLVESSGAAGGRERGTDFGNSESRGDDSGGAVPDIDGDVAPWLLDYQFDEAAAIPERERHDLAVSRPRGPRQAPMQ